MKDVQQAPGAPGLEPRWTSSSKSGIGKAINPASEVTFTLSHGILNEIFYPREDIACIRDMEFLVADGHEFFSEEKRDTEHSTKTIKTGIPAYKIKNSCRGKYTLTKEIVCDPYRNTVLQKVKFSPNEKTDNLHLYALMAPHLNDEGANNSGWVGEHKGVPMLFAENAGLTVAMACSSGWVQRSVGFVGRSDGWTDLSQHKSMEWKYTSADHGNIALTGEIDLSAGSDFLIAISFGRTKGEAANHALASVLDGFEQSKNTYINEWDKWHKNLRKVKAKYFRISASVLRMHEAKNFPGGLLASLSTPWGNTRGDSEKGGYHLVWPRDMVESAGGFLAMQSHEDVVRIVNFLMSTQNADGSWPQNMWLQGEPYWTGLQMDEIALPVLEVYRSYEKGAIDEERIQRYWTRVRKALAFLVQNGPFTREDRWEEEAGYSVFTLATEIAALLAGARMAETNGESLLADFLRQTADNWNANIETWTYVTGTDLAKEVGVDGYYIRINPFRDIPASDLGDKTMNLKNHKNGEGEVKISEHVSVDALALVRFGLRAADDTKILNTLKVIDAKLKIDTPNGPCWYRYTNDGYGEHENGDPFDGTGKGRAWPLLTGERGHYEVAAGNYDKARELLQAMDSFANDGLLSEQIWDQDDIPEKELYFGRFSGSAMPLTWAHAEYLKLSASIHEKAVHDMPSVTQNRYLHEHHTSDFEMWRFDAPLKRIPSDKKLRIETSSAAKILWTSNGWKDKDLIETEDRGLGIYFVDIKFKNKTDNLVEFTFYWLEVGKWENRNYRVEIE